VRFEDADHAARPGHEDVAFRSGRFDLPSVARHRFSLRINLDARQMHKDVADGPQG
jgi:hypothetical protein